MNNNSIAMNSFGRVFRVTVFGESHGSQIGVTIDGIPAGIPLHEDDFMNDINSRKPGKEGTTPRLEKDTPAICSGLFNNFTTGAPLTILFENKNVKSSDYTRSYLRPGHSDFPAFVRSKGFNDYRGGGHFSGRITLPIVAAGVIAKKIIDPMHIESKIISLANQTNFDEAINIALEKKDSIGGIINCDVSNVPIGLGEPFFDSVESILSHAMFSIPGIKGIEFGKGFKAAEMYGSDYNDNFIDASGKTSTNNSGGINGGLTNGNNITFNLAVRPTASISLKQNYIDTENNSIIEHELSGRHDTCFALRLSPVINAMTAIAIADLKLIASSFA